jgi:hypothetical protein
MTKRGLRNFVGISRTRQCLKMSASRDIQSGKGTSLWIQWSTLILFYYLESNVFAVNSQMVQILEKVSLPENVRQAFYI